MYTQNPHDADVMTQDDLRVADKYQVEIANTIIESVVITSSTNDRVDFSVNDRNGKIVITAKSSEQR